MFEMLLGDVQLQGWITSGEERLSAGGAGVAELSARMSERGSRGPLEDLLGQRRGGCRQCPCKAYALDSECVTVNMNAADARCARCGCNVAGHAVLRRPGDKSPKPSEGSPSPARRKKEPSLGRCVACSDVEYRRVRDCSVWAGGVTLILQ